MTFYKVFQGAIDYGYNVRKQKLDGLQKWNELKASLPNVPIGCGWKINWTSGGDDDDIESLYNYVHNHLGMEGDESDTTKHEIKTWERYHFLLQLIRIPKNNPKPTFVRLAQVAYNIGQYMAEAEAEPYSQDVIAFLRDNNLDTMSSYIDSLYVEEVYKTMLQ